MNARFYFIALNFFVASNPSVAETAAGRCAAKQIEVVKSNTECAKQANASLENCKQYEPRTQLSCMKNVTTTLRSCSRDVPPCEPADTEQKQKCDAWRLELNKDLKDGEEVWQSIKGLPDDCSSARHSGGRRLTGYGNSIARTGRFYERCNKAESQKAVRLGQRLFQLGSPIVTKCGP